MRVRVLRQLTVASLGILGALVVSSPAQAQGNIRHDGFYFGVGLGIGWAKYNGDASDGTTESGFSGNLRLGGHIRPNVLLGGETNGFYKSLDGATATWGSVMATTAVYPGKSLPLYLKGGLGYMFTDISDDFDAVTSNHFAFQLGTGVDLKIGRGSAITFYFNWIKGLSGALQFEGSTLGDVSPSIMQVGAAFSLY